jgi:hypothetical protein
VGQRCTGGNPVGFAGISKIFGIGHYPIKVVECVGLRLTDGSRNAGLERIGIGWIAASKAVGTDTTVAIF